MVSLPSAASSRLLLLDEVLLFSCQSSWMEYLPFAFSAGSAAPRRADDRLSLYARHRLVVALFRRIQSPIIRLSIDVVAPATIRPSSVASWLPLSAHGKRHKWAPFFPISCVILWRFCMELWLNWSLPPGRSGHTASHRSLDKSNHNTRYCRNYFGPSSHVASK